MERRCTKLMPVWKNSLDRIAPVTTVALLSKVRDDASRGHRRLAHSTRARQDARGVGAGVALAKLLPEGEGKAFAAARGY
eukprot:scaffold88575_cov69-Phaeocystis_antarctica.AAC.3